MEAASGRSTAQAAGHLHWAERVACRYLEAKGMRLLAHNYRLRGGEIDLVMADGDELVAVEVKQRRSAAYGHPAEHISQRQLARVRAAAHHYANFVHGRSGGRLRIDAVLLLGTERQHRITHLRGIA